MNFIFLSVAVVAVIILDLELTFNVDHIVCIIDTRTLIKKVIQHHSQSTYTMYFGYQQILFISPKILKLKIFI